MRRTNDTPFALESEQPLRFGAFASYALSILIFITLCLAMIAVPISGAHAPGGGISYPYLETIGQFPRDYLWQYSALIMAVLYTIHAAVIAASVRPEKKIYANIGLVFTSMVSLILLVNYYVQVSVVPVSLMSGETAGIPLLTQYNPHGVFIAMEELAFSLMLIPFLALVKVFDCRTRTCAAIRILFGAAVIISAAAFIYLSIRFGLDRKDRYEVVVISVTLLTLIVNSLLIGRVFRAAATQKGA